METQHLIVLAGFSENAHGRLSKILRKEFVGSATKWCPYDRKYSANAVEFCERLSALIDRELQSRVPKEVGRLFLSVLVERRFVDDEFAAQVGNKLAPHAFVVFVDREPEPQIFGKLRGSLLGLNRFAKRLLTQTEGGNIRRAAFVLPWMNFNVPEFRPICIAMSQRRFNNIDRALTQLKDLQELTSTRRTEGATVRDERGLRFKPAELGEWHAWDARTNVLFEDFRAGCMVPRGFHYDVSCPHNHISAYQLMDRLEGRVRARSYHVIANIYPNDAIRFKNA